MNSRIFFVALLLIAFQASSTTANNAVYKKTVPATAFILAGNSRGSGVLVDTDKKLVVTALHVTGAYTKVRVVFPQFDTVGNAINSRGHYLQGNVIKPELVITGTVITKFPSRDLAVIQLESSPIQSAAISLASKSARPGEDIHHIGNSTWQNGGLFDYAFGKVRSVFIRQGGGVLRGRAILVTQIPTNPGGSGGPIVNNQAELVGIVSRGTIGVPAQKGSPFYQKQVTDHSIDISEIHHALANLDRKPKVVFTAIGSLSTDSPFDTIRKSSYAKSHKVYLPAGKTYQVSITSTDFDTYLRIEENGKQLAADDDGGVNLDSLSNLTVGNAGHFHVIVTSYAAGQTGKYKLTITE